MRIRKNKPPLFIKGVTQMLCLVRGVITLKNNSSRIASFTRFPNPIAYPHVKLEHEKQ